MAQLIRPLRHWPRLHHHCCSAATFHRLLFPPILAIKTIGQRLSFTKVPSSHRSVHFRSRGLRLRNAPVPSDLEESNASDSDADARKTRNERKREARRAVRWGMELASFSTAQIKRILRVAALEREVFDALMLVKRLGPDVREGKRRQFNYIGKLLRKVQPELMDALIQASKDGDHSRLQSLSGSGISTIGDDDDDDDEEAEES
ncbi:hypothetical protein L1049_026632 [Liquidambar formosana]|uniref:Uncharacterized protein n=1 Tax=Liquidambar formosana TaxID=63359 RepID=A0AAP0NE24_LIQFO